MIAVIGSLALQEKPVDTAIPVNDESLKRIAWGEAQRGAKLANSKFRADVCDCSGKRESIHGDAESQWNRCVPRKRDQDGLRSRAFEEAAASSTKRHKICRQEIRERAVDWNSFSSPLSSAASRPSSLL